MKELEDQLLERIARRFCPSSEASGQLNLFDKAEVSVPTKEEIKEEKQQEQKSGKKRVRKQTILSVPADTPIVVRFHALCGENKDCRRCGTPLKVTGIDDVGRHEELGIHH